MRIGKDREEEEKEKKEEKKKKKEPPCLEVGWMEKKEAKTVSQLKSHSK